MIDLGGEQKILADLPAEKGTEARHIIDPETGEFEDAAEWIYSLSDLEILHYIDPVDYNKQFWEEVGPDSMIYHGTPEDNLESIRAEGLGQRDETRGMSNRGTGAAVFATWNQEAADKYTYPHGVVIGIHLGKMKAAKYMPQVAMEGPIEEKLAQEALASKLGLEDFYVDVESGIEEDTVVIYGDIPPQFLVFPNGVQ
jgi:hypothetical protein